MELALRNSRIRLLTGDITKIRTDAMVNAANSRLAGGGGVDGAIHAAGGPAIMAELDQLRPAGGCPTGSAVATGAGDLPAKWVIHAVGPIWRGGIRGEAGLLRNAYLKSLSLAAERGARTVTLPSISTGAYGYPAEQAAATALRAVADFLLAHERPIEEAVFVLFDPKTYAAYARALAALGKKT